MKTLRLFLAAVLFALLVNSCNNPFNAADTPEAGSLPDGKGSLSLRIAGPSGRTIMPEAVEFEKEDLFYELIFTGADGTEETVTGNYDKIVNPVILNLGTYSLEVNAYADENYDQLLFSGTSALITIEEGKTTPVEITLQPVLEGGEGTFSWDITLPDDVIYASMEITKKDGGTLVERITLYDKAANADATEGARKLDSGFYDVIIEITGKNPDYEEPLTVTRKEILHIYKGRESKYKSDFANIDFNIVYTVTFQLGGYSHTDKFVHGSGVSAGYFDDDILKNLPDDAYLCLGNPDSVPSYTVEGLYSIEDGPTEVNWDMQDDVFTKDITLYARLGGPIDVSKSAGNTNFEKIVNFINSITTTNNTSYTLFIADEVDLTQPLTIKTGVTLTVTSAGATASTINRDFEDTEAESGLFIVGNEANLTFENITIDGKKGNTEFSANAAPLVRVNEGGTFTMNDGAVLKDNRTNKGGVYVKGQFTMNGGTTISGIEYCSGCGNGVYVDIGGQFTMTGGTISGNTAYESGGGGVWVKGQFTMTDGTISDNTVSGDGAGGGGVLVSMEGEFTMTGGEISGNTDSSKGSNGGGVYVYGTLVLGGTAVIKDNYRGSNNNNVYLSGNKYITLGTDDNAPQDGMEIWVQTATANGVIVNSGATSGDAKYFHADDEANSFIIFDNGKLVLKTPTLDKLTFTLIDEDGNEVTDVSEATAYRVRKPTTGTLSGELVIPSHHDDLPVTEIGSASDDSTSGAFANTTITAVYIPATVTSIGSSAFSRCSNLESVIFAADSLLTSIGNGAFERCTGLTGITIPATVTSIGSSAFSRCSNLESVTFAADSLLTSIGDSAFYVCTSLTSVTIPAGVTNVGNSAFSTCTSLTSITIPAGVTTIGNNAFEFSGLETIIFAEDSQLQTIGTATFNACESLISVTIPASVTTIGADAFSTCTSLTSIFFPAGLTAISDSAFYDCASLTSITIPASVTTIGGGAFSNCTSLTSITVEETNANYLSDDGVLYNKAKSVIVAFPGNKTGITIPASVTEIGLSAFQGTKLITITFEADSQLQTINRQAFSNCKSLTSITIPASVTTIRDSAFSGCTSLTTVTCLAITPPTLLNGAFQDTPPTLQIKVPAGSVSVYQTQNETNTNNWYNYRNQISAIED